MTIMNRKELTFGMLVLAMAQATKYLDFYAQRDMVADIAELDDMVKEEPKVDFSVTWFLRNNGTCLGYECDFKPVAVYTLTYHAIDGNHPYGSWSIQERQL